MRLICVFKELSDSSLDQASDEYEASGDEDDDEPIRGAKRRTTSGTKAERQQRQAGYDQKWR